MKVEEVDIESLTLDATNVLDHEEDDIEAIRESLRRFDQQKPVVVSADNVVIAGNGTVQAAILEGRKKIWVNRSSLSGARAKAYSIADNKTGRMAKWNDENLLTRIREIEEEDSALVASVGFSEEELEELRQEAEDGIDSSKAARSSLAEKFGVPPFSVLDTRQGYWKERKAAWLSLGIKSELGREANLLKMSDTILAGGFEDAKAKARKRIEPGGGGGPNSAYLREGAEGSGTSIFDPVLCELLYRWYCPPGGIILDPFAGGSVRGIVAAMLGRHYWGVDLSEGQLRANAEQAAAILTADGSGSASWMPGDSLLWKFDKDSEKADFLIACPPYWNLERYSEDARDLSNMSWEKFRDALSLIIKKWTDRLKANRFAAFIVSNVRDEEGNYKDLVGAVCDAMEARGLSLYNEAILLNSVGSAAMRASRIFGSLRKLVRVHQSVLVFLKGDAKRACEAIGQVEAGDIEAEEGEAPAPSEAQEPGAFFGEIGNVGSDEGMAEGN